MISIPSFESIVIIETSDLSFKTSLRSFWIPSTTTAIADLASPGPISFARSNPVDSAGNSLELLSGNTIFIGVL